MIQNSCIPIQNILRGFSINGSVIRFKQHAPTSSTPVGVVKSLDVDSIPNEARISISRAVLCHGFKRKNKEKMIRPPILNASSSHPRPLPIPHPMTHSPVRATLDICVSIVSSESLALDVLHQRLHLVVVQLLQPLGDDRVLVILQLAGVRHVLRRHPEDVRAPPEQHGDDREAHPDVPPDLDLVKPERSGGDVVRDQRQDEEDHGQDDDPALCAGIEEDRQGGF